MFGKLKKLFSGNSSKSESLYSSLAESKHSSLWKSILGIFRGKVSIDEEVLEQMEELLLSADVSFETTSRILDKINALYKEQKDKKTIDDEFFKSLILESTLSLFQHQEEAENKIAKEDLPYIMLVIGVNGAGKTTTIAKLTHQLKNEGIKIVLGAADTFRAGATEQLEMWANRLQVPLIKKEYQSSPAAVAFDTIKYAKDESLDMAIIDTSGRLHNNVNLMSELKKVVTTIQKQIPNAPHETILVIDGTSGQNAIEQAKKFCEVAPISGIIVTKLDGTAKGGILISIADTLNIPIRYIGVGEKLDDLVVFDAKSYLEKLIH